MQFAFHGFVAGTGPVVICCQIRAAAAQIIIIQLHIPQGAGAHRQGMLAHRLRKQRAAGSSYYIGESLTAVDVYSATFAAMFAPLPPAQCDMDAGTRAAFETRDAQTAAALDPILFEHRDMMYAEHLELPLSL